MKIKAVTRQWEGGGYYRVRLPLSQLESHGHEVSVVGARSDVRAGGADVVVGQMIGGKGNAEIVHAWWRNMAKTSRLVYELDDDPFEIEHHNPAFSAYSGGPSHDSLRHCIEIADLVTASTEPLAERMRQINSNVVVLKNRIDEHVLDLVRPKRDKLTIGWAGSTTHREDIKECAYGVRKTLDHNPHVEAHFIGADFRDLIRRPVRFSPWAMKTTDYYKLIDFDIGLAPLKPTVFAEAKSHIKALEYAALGIPVIASDVAPYRDFVVDGVTGWLVRKPHEWAQRLRDLIHDDSMRAEMGAKSRVLAAEWTIQRGWQEWQSAYESVL